MTQAQRLTVYFDGSCPLCQREIGYYRGKQGADAIEWIDVSVDDPQSGDLSCDVAMKRFHVRKPDGELINGGAGFITLWQHHEAFKSWGKFFARRPFRWLVTLGYEIVLPIRPAIQWLFRRTIGD